MVRKVGYGGAYFEEGARESAPLTEAEKRELLQLYLDGWTVQQLERSFAVHKVKRLRREVSLAQRQEHDANRVKRKRRSAGRAPPVTPE
jgi:hypothetical protein